MDTMYMLKALADGHKDFDISSDFLNRAYCYREMDAATVVFTWLTIVSVRVSFLALFSRLIDQMPHLIIYWWIVVAFHVVVSAYGVSAPVLACLHCYYSQPAK